MSSTAPDWSVRLIARRAAIVRVPAPSRTRSRPSFSVVEATIADMRARDGAGRVTSRDIVPQSLVRIALYEDRLNAAIT